MPPTRFRVPLDEPKAENSRERGANGTSKAKRSAFNVPAAPLGAASGKDNNSAAPGTIAPTDPYGAPHNDSAMHWPQLTPTFLNDYRTLHRLDAPSSFSSALSAAVLTASGIGRHSPTMVRRKEKRRVPQEQLAMALRQHFNSAAVDEKELIGEFVYVVKCGDQKFRRRFRPATPKR